MDWLRLFSPDTSSPADAARPRPLPEPCEATNWEDRVAVLALRRKRGQELWHPLDWVGELDPTAFHGRLGWGGQDRFLNGEDKRPGIVSMDPFDEFKDDDPELPSGWLEEELAAFRALCKGWQPTKEAA
jgi:hypothetical protein